MTDRHAVLSRAITATDLLVVGDDCIGVLAAVVETLDAAKVPIEGLAAFTGGQRALIHVCVTTPETARLALQRGGFEVAEARQAYVFNVPDRPGGLAALAADLAADLNVDVVYLAPGPRCAVRVVVCPATRSA